MSMYISMYTGTYVGSQVHYMGTLLLSLHVHTSTSIIQVDTHNIFYTPRAYHLRIENAWCDAARSMLLLNSSSTTTNASVRAARTKATTCR